MAETYLSTASHCERVERSCIILASSNSGAPARPFASVVSIIHVKPDERTITAMGSAALAEAARSIRDWSINEGRAAKRAGEVVVDSHLDAGVGDFPVGPLLAAAGRRGDPTRSSVAMRWTNRKGASHASYRSRSRDDAAV